MGTLTVSPPLIITPRLMVGAPLAGGYLSIGYSDRAGDGGRTRYVYAIDAGPDYLPEGHVGPLEHEGDDLQSGAGGGTLQDGFRSLIAFLSAAGEAHAYYMRNRTGTPEPSGFPVWVDVWAAEHSDELEALALELETPDLIWEG